MQKKLKKQQPVLCCTGECKITESMTIFNENMNKCIMYEMSQYTKHASVCLSFILD